VALEHRQTEPVYAVQYALRVELPPYLQDYRATLLRHPATQWAANIYRLHRGLSAEVSRRAAAR